MKTFYITTEHVLLLIILLQILKVY